jgi:hypothetical protein
LTFSHRASGATGMKRSIRPSDAAHVGNRGYALGCSARATLGCFDVSAVRARLALSIVRVSVRPPCHPGQSHLANPVGDHDCPSAIFPVSRRLKRSLAYPHATQVYCTVRWPNTCSTFSGAESGASAHLPSGMTESPFTPSRRYPVLIATTGSCVSLSRPGLLGKSRPPKKCPSFRFRRVRTWRGAPRHAATHRRAPYEAGKAIRCARHRREPRPCELGRSTCSQAQHRRPSGKPQTPLFSSVPARPVPRQQVRYPEPRTRIYGSWTSPVSGGDQHGSVLGQGRSARREAGRTAR